MSAEALLAWARGPAFEVALVIFIAGMLLRLLEILSLGRKPDLSEARGSGPSGGARTLFSRFLPQSSILAREPVRIFNAYVLHIGLFAIIFLFGPHIAIFKSLLGFSWPNLPSGVIDALSAITLISLVVALVIRLNNPTLRFLSTGGDYWAWFITLLPVLTGYLAYNHLLLPYTLMLALHILSVELLMISAPFSKLTHMFSFVLSRWYQGYQAGHRGIES
jgi:nitrate reductase gamma subunit